MAKLPKSVGKTRQQGNRIVRHGLPKKKGGIGLHTTARNRRTFKSNMQRKRIQFSDGTVKRMWVRVKDLKAGLYDNPDKATIIEAHAASLQ